MRKIKPKRLIGLILGILFAIYGPYYAGKLTCIVFPILNSHLELDAEHWIIGLFALLCLLTIAGVMCFFYFWLTGQDERISL